MASALLTFLVMILGVLALFFSLNASAKVLILIQQDMDMHIRGTNGKKCR